MAKLTFEDYLIAYGAMLSQLAATFLLVEHGDWGRKFSEASKRMIVAGVTVIFLIILYFVLRRRPRGQVGYQLPTVIKMITSASAMTLFVVINEGFQEHTIEKLWACENVFTCAYCLVELTRAAKPSGMTVFVFLFSSAIYKTEGHQYWRIFYGVMLVAMLLLKSSEELNLRREAEEAKKTELKAEQLKAEAEAVTPKEEEKNCIYVGSSGTIST